jgi:hypothetical protein
MQLMNRGIASPCTARHQHRDRGDRDECFTHFGFLFVFGGFSRTLRTPAFGPEDEEQFNNFVERIRPRHLSAAERAERDLARQAAHVELARKEAEIAEVEQRNGYREIEAQLESANSAVWDAEYDVMEAKPATLAGAVALLRFVAGLMEGFFPDDDEHEHYVGAIRNAADFFEGGPRHGPEND